MSALDLHAISPLIALAGTALTSVLVIAFRRHHGTVAMVSMAGFVLSLSLLPPVASLTARQATPFLLVDRFAIFSVALMATTGLAVAVLSFGYLEKHGGPREEFYPLLVLTVLGASVMVSSSHFASLFLGLELLTVSLYCLISYLLPSKRGIEAGFKYLILAAAASAFLLFGMALVYAEAGTMELGRISALRAQGDLGGALLVGGMGMMIVGIGFKLALVPFHLWTPDVYEGAPAPVTALVATVSKGAMLFVLLRYSGHLGLITYRPLVLLLSAIAVLSMSFGNLLALRQSNVKRILAYSSIAHVGYFLVAFLAAGEIAATSIVYYLVSYIATTLGAFAVVALLSGNARDADGIDDYRGLAYRHPWIAGTFTLMILSLAGIPLTAGFMGKFYVAAAGVSAGLWLLVTALIVNSAVGIFYYLRIIAALYSRVQDEGYAHNEGDKIPFRYPGLFVLAAASLAVLGLGVYPSPLIALIQTAVAGGL